MLPAHTADAPLQLPSKLPQVERVRVPLVQLGRPHAVPPAALQLLLPLQSLAWQVGADALQTLLGSMPPATLLHVPLAQVLQPPHTAVLQQTLLPPAIGVQNSAHCSLRVQVAPAARSAMRIIPARLATGMIPARIGTRMPARSQRSRKSKKSRLSKNNYVQM